MWLSFAFESLDNGHVFCDTIWQKRIYDLLLTIMRFAIPSDCVWWQRSPGNPDHRTIRMSFRTPHPEYPEAINEPAPKPYCSANGGADYDQTGQT